QSRRYSNILFRGRNNHLNISMQASKFSLVAIAAAAVITIPVLLQYGRSRPLHIVLWAWERPENLEFIDPSDISVAFLAKTIRLRADENLITPRRQSLRMPPGTELVAVVRIEGEDASLSPRQLDETVSAVSQMARLDHIGTIQIDYDAKESERSFYRAMLQGLRRQAPPTTRV